MRWILDLYRSTLVKKAIMAVTGVVLFGFVLTHMLGNLKLFQGAEKINAYAGALRGLGAPFLAEGDALWLTRIVLLGAVGLHILSAWQLTVINRRARPEGYVRREHRASTYASRTMRWGGVIILLFVIYHLLHMTVGSVHADFVPHDVHHNLVTAFQNPLVAGFYLLAVTALGFHLYHGLWSMFQSLGWSGPRLDSMRRAFAVLFAVAVTVGYATVPIAILAGVVTLGD